MEEPVSAEVVRAIFNLQPHYIGNLQTVGSEGIALTQEEKVLIDFHFCLFHALYS